MIRVQYLRCPDCGAGIIEKNQSHLECTLCRATFDSTGGILRLTSEKLGSFKDTEKNFWDYQYQNKQLNYDPNRDEVFHHQFKFPLKNLPNGANVLEVACGWRLDSIEIALAGKNITAIDLSEQAIPISRELAKQAGVADKISFATADAANLPFQDNTFDGAFIAASIHHLPDPLGALKEMGRVVKPGAPVVLGVEPNSWPYYSIYPLLYPLKWVIRRIRKRPYNSIADDQTRGFTERKLMELFWLAELKVELIERVKYAEEVYDKFCALMERFNIKPNPYKTDLSVIRKIDNQVARLPFLKNLNWHWNVIGRKRR